MATSAALTLVGAALLYLAMIRSGRQRAIQLRDLGGWLAGTLAVSGGCALAVAARGWGVGVTSTLVMLMLAMSALALAAPLWPWQTRSAVGLVVAALFAHALGCV